MNRRRVEPYEYVSAGIAALLIAYAVTLMAGCAAGVADTYASLTVQERALQVAAVSLIEVQDNLERKCINEGSDRQEVDNCKTRVRAKTDVAIKSIIAAQAATVTAKDMLQGVAAASKAPKEVMSWVGVAVRAYVDVSAALAQLGITLGG